MNNNFPLKLEPFAERLYDVLLWNDGEDPRDNNGQTKEENMRLIRKTLQEVYDLGKSDEAADEYNRIVE